MSRRLHLVNRYCPQQRARVPADQYRFAVRITRPDGSVDETVARGGDSFGHAVAAIDRAAEGSRISVRRLPSHVAGEPA